MFVVDTNILIHAAISESIDHDAARRALERWRGESSLWFATWPILYEFLRVTTHRRVFRQPLSLDAARQFIDTLLQTPHFDLLTETDRHGEILRELAGEYPAVAGNLVHDFHTVVLMKEHGVSEIRTADTDFHQFKFLRVHNPLIS